VNDTLPSFIKIVPLQGSPAFVFALQVLRSFVSCAAATAPNSISANNSFFMFIVFDLV